MDLKKALLNSSFLCSLFVSSYALALSCQNPQAQACQFEASGVAGGSAFSMVLTSCLIKKTRERNKELEALANCQEGDLSCPAR